MRYTSIRTIFGGKGTIAVTTATCPMCGTAVPVDPDGWDTLCWDCAQQEAREVRRLRAQRYCWRCNGAHNPTRVHLKGF